MEESLFYSGSMEKIAKCTSPKNVFHKFKTVDILFYRELASSVDFQVMQKNKVTSCSGVDLNNV